MRYHIIRKYRIDIFILISFFFHILFAYVSGYLRLSSTPLQKNDPVKVTFLEEKKPSLKGRIMETPKPLQEEKPLDQQVLSEQNSRMHSNIGEKSDTYRDHETVIPKSIPRPAASPSPAMEKTPPPPKKVEEKTTEKKLEKVPEAKTEFKKMAKAERDEKKEVAPSESLVRKKYSPNEQETKSTADSPRIMEKSSPLETPLLDGTDLGKYARLDTGAESTEKPSADSDTISLDTQEFKYVSYFAQIKRKIELVWSYPAEAGRNGLFGRLLLKFTIRKDGSLENLQLIDSTGHQILDDEALRAVRMASPYPPFPKRIDKDKLNIIASFSYYPSFGLVQ